MIDDGMKATLTTRMSAPWARPAWANAQARARRREGMRNKSHSCSQQPYSSELRKDTLSPPAVRRRSPRNCRRGCRAAPRAARCAREEAVEAARSTPTPQFGVQADGERIGIRHAGDRRARVGGEILVAVDRHVAGASGPRLPADADVHRGVDGAVGEVRVQRRGVEGADRPVGPVGLVLPITS